MSGFLKNINVEKICVCACKNIATSLEKKFSHTASLTDVNQMEWIELYFI